MHLFCISRGPLTPLSLKSSPYRIFTSCDRFQAGSFRQQDIIISYGALLAVEVRSWNLEMSLSSAFAKSAGSGQAAAAFVPPVIISAPPPANPKDKRKRGEDGAEGGRKRSRSEMEGRGGGRRRQMDEEDSDEEGAGGKNQGKPVRRARETKERAERTVFVGQVPVSWTKKQLADLFQKHLNEARARGEFVGKTLTAEEKIAEEKQDYQKEEEDNDDGSDSDSEGEEDDAKAKSAHSSAAAPPAKRSKKDSDADAGSAAAAAAGSSDDAKDGKETTTTKDAKKAEPSSSKNSNKKKKKVSRDIESIRFRSIPVAALAVAPGSDFRAMAKAAFIKKSFSTDAGGTMNGELRKLRKNNSDDDNDSKRSRAFFCLHLFPLFFLACACLQPTLSSRRPMPSSSPSSSTTPGSTLRASFSATTTIPAAAAAVAVVVAVLAQALLQAAVLHLLQCITCA